MPNAKYTKNFELGSMEVLKEVPFGRVVMGLLVFLKVGIIWSCGAYNGD